MVCSVAPAAGVWRGRRYGEDPSFTLAGSTCALGGGAAMRKAGGAQKVINDYYYCKFDTQFQLRISDYFALKCLCYVGCLILCTITAFSSFASLRVSVGSDSSLFGNVVMST